MDFEEILAKVHTFYSVAVATQLSLVWCFDRIQLVSMRRLCRSRLIVMAKGHCAEVVVQTHGSTARHVYCPARCCELRQFISINDTMSERTVDFCAVTVSLHDGMIFHSQECRMGTLQPCGSADVAYRRP